MGQFCVIMSKAKYSFFAPSVFPSPQAEIETRQISISNFYFPYKDPKFLQARTSEAMSFQNIVHAEGRQICSSGILCIHTGIRRIEAKVIRSAPI